MTTTRYFEVKIESCKGCPYSRRMSRNFEFCNEASLSERAGDIYEENKNQLTDSCPMAAQHKESETK